MFSSIAPIVPSAGLSSVPLLSLCAVIVSSVKLISGTGFTLIVTVIGSPAQSPVGSPSPIKSLNGVNVKVIDPDISSSIKSMLPIGPASKTLIPASVPDCVLTVAFAMLSTAVIATVTPVLSGATRLLAISINVRLSDPI